MPLFDYVCPGCGLTQETLVRQSTDEIPCPRCLKEERVWYHLVSDPESMTGPFVVLMERQQAAPAFVVKGFNQATGYTGARTFTKNHGNGIRTTVTGNPEGFSEGLV